MTTWQPNAPLPYLKKRAKILSEIRAFFAAHQIMEVETPLLCQHTVTDVHIDSFTCKDGNATRYLQTSPEYAMKRLLAAGSGPIYQISKAFRVDEVSDTHNPEFTLLEWYQPGYTHHQLMQEVDELLQTILATPPADIVSYQHIFEEYVKLNPHIASQPEVLQSLADHGIDIDTTQLIKDDGLHLLMTHCIEPHLGHDRPIFIYDYPHSQAALAKLNDEKPPRAERFELYVKGTELANGFHELTDANEQQQRFRQDLDQRKQSQRTTPEIDKRFIAALAAGLPDCAGVAMGIDRLLLLALNASALHQVISFTFDRA